MKDTLLIYDTDPVYSRQLAEKLSLREDVPQEVHWFAEPEELLAAARAAEVPVVLAARGDRDEATEELLRLSKAGEIVLMFLTEIRGYERIEDIPAVFKYRPVSLILKDILASAEEERERGSGAEYTRASFIGVMSPVGRALKTSFCLTLGQLLSRGGRVLYVNLETCSGFRAIFGREFESDLSDLLYAYQTGGEAGALPEVTESFHGVDVLPPASMPEDIYRTDPLLMKNLLLKLAREREYQFVILDLGTDFRLGEVLLPLCGLVYVPSRNEPVSETKAKEFMVWLERMKGDRRIRAENLVLPQRQPFISGKEYSEQLLWSELGDFVRDLLGGMY